MRIPGGFAVHTAFALKYQRIIHIEGMVYAKMLYLGFIPVAKVIKPKTVKIGVYDFFELFFDFHAFGGIHDALKHRVLHPVTIVHAFLGDLSQPFSALRRFGVDVIGDQN